MSSPLKSTKSRTSTTKSKSVDPNALPQFKAPIQKQSINQSINQPTAPILPTEFAASEQRQMEQRLASLKTAMAEERAKREEAMRHREANPIHQSINGQSINQLTGSEYRAQLKERLARKAEAMKEKQASLASMMNQVNLSTNPHKQSINQPIHQSNNQSNNQPTNQSNNQSTNRTNGSPTSVSGRTSQSMTIEELKKQSPKQPIRQSINQSTNQPINQSIHQPINQSINQSSYVSPVRSTDLSAFQAVSEKWLNDEKEVIIDQSTNQSINWLEALQTQPIPRPVISLVNDQPINQSTNQSLIDGSEFDEAESAKSFQEARLAWLASINQPINQSINRPQTAKKDSGTGTINQSTSQSTNHEPDHRSARFITRPSTSQSINRSINQSLLDGPDFDERESANAFAEARKEWLNSQSSNQSTNQSTNSSTSQSVNQSTNQPINQPRPMIETAEARFCCYHCYKLVPLKQALMSQPINQSTNQPTNQSTINQSINQSIKQLCSESCRESYESSQRQQAQQWAKAASQAINQPNDQPNDQPINQPTNQPASQPTNQSTNQSVIRPDTASSLSRPMTAARVIHTVTNSSTQPKPKVIFPDDD